MKNSIDIIDIIDIKLMQLNRSHAVTTPEHKSYFQGMIDSLTELRKELMNDLSQHIDQTAAIIAKM
jgi:hypothetical protein